MAPKKPSSSASPIQIGNCEVIVEANNFICKSDPKSLEISVSRNAKIKISVKEDLNRKCNHDVWQSKAEQSVEGWRNSSLEDDYMFVLVNPKDADSCSKCYLPEILKIYTRELPTMSYAANTGKQSMFLERCISNGKYFTLLLKSKSPEGFGEVIGAITYQIVPTNIQYAEIPLAAVGSIYQQKGLASFLYLELRKRLQSVGIRTIFCWGDKESEGFWLKQGFASIAEVDRKGRAHRLPIKANIRRALSFPGGSTLMVSHLNEETPANAANSLNFCYPLKSDEKSSQAIDKSVEHRFTGKGYNTLESLNQITSKVESSHPEGLIRDGFCREDTNSGGFFQSSDCGGLDPYEGVECSKMTTGSELANIGVVADVKHFSCYTRGAKRKAWETSLSSLKSKKVKGSQQIDCVSGSTWGLDSESNGIRPCFNECSLGISKNSSFVEVTPADPLTSQCVENNAKSGSLINITSEDLANKELQSKGECFRIMLMNIADDTKKRHLTKVIEKLGAAVTPVGSVSTHVVTRKVRTTVNFCTALCSGAWIVSSSWLKESFRKGIFVDESPYILYDEDYMLKYRTELKNAVLRAKVRPKALLNGYGICIAAHVQPPVEILIDILKSAGGNIICGLDNVTEPSKTIFVACEEDMEEALLAAKKGIVTFGSDWLMNCIMRQELDLEAQQFAESL